MTESNKERNNMGNKVVILATNIVAINSAFFNKKKQNMIEEIFGDTKEFQYEDVISYIDEKDLRKYSKAPKAFRFYSLSTKMAIASMNRAIRNMKYQDRFQRVDEYARGIIIGTSYGNAGTKDLEVIAEYIDAEYQFDYLRFGKEGIRDFPPLWILGRLPNTPAGQMAIEEEVRGLVLSVANGWSSSLVAIGEAYLALKQKRAKMIITGGTDNQLDTAIEVELMCNNLLCFEKEGMSYSHISNKNVFTNAAGTLILEEKEDSLSLGDVAIVGYSNHYIGDLAKVSNNKIAKEMELCMMQALEENKIEIQKIVFIQASAGVDSRLDRAEMTAIQKIFGSSVLVTCAQSHMGNTRAASGAISTIFAYLQLKSGYIVPVTNGEEMLLDEMKHKNLRKLPLTTERERYCLVNAFSPFGELASIILEYKE